MGVRLPSAYQEVEYLERIDTTTNGPYIITNIFGDNNLDFHMKAMCYQTGGDRTFFGSRNSFSGASAQIYNVVNASGGKFGFGNHTWNYWPSINIAGGEVFTVQKIGSTVESSGGANFSVAGEPEFTTPYTLEIFAMSTGTQNRHNQEGLNGRIYSLKFSRNGKTIADFVPCYRKQDHKPGMFDLCGSVCDITDSPFYVSANTGEFLVGPDVIDSISPWLVARRRMLMRKPSLNTSPRIAEYNKRLVSSSRTQNATGMCYTEWIEANPTTFSGANPVIIFGGVIKDGNHIYQFEKHDGTFDYWNTGKPYLTSGSKRLRFTLDIATISSAYGYNKYSGQIYFAGPDTIYYGYTNINDMPQG